MASNKKQPTRKMPKRKAKKDCAPPVPRPASPPPTPSNPPPTIHDFPDEILEQIIVYGVALDFKIPHKPSRTIRHISHVCRRWYVLTTGTPSLWADSIDFEGSDSWNQLVLKRARGASLSLILPSVTNSTEPEMYGGTQWDSSPRLGELLMRQNTDLPSNKLLHHTTSYVPSSRHVAVRISDEIWTDFNRFNGLDVEKLESLTVVRSGSEPLASILDVIVFHPDIFADDTLLWKLRQLDLRGCSTQITATAYYLLEELTIHDVPQDASVSPVAWIGILKNMKNLRRLELVNATMSPKYNREGEFEVCGYPGPVVDLRKLEYLKLDAPLHHCSCFLSNLSIPPICDLALSCCGFSELGPSFTAFLNGIESQLKRGRSLGQHLLLAVTKDSCVIRTERRMDTPLLDVSLRWNQRSPLVPASIWGPIVARDVLRAMMTAIRRRCGTVTDLELFFDVPIDRRRHPKVLSEIIRPFKNVQRLHRVSTSTVFFLLPAFAPLICGDDLEEPPEPTHFVDDFLPSLKAISFYAVDFAKLAAHGKRPLTRLAVFAQRRSRTVRQISDKGKARLSPISRVSFSLCGGVGEKAVRALEKHHIEVTRDGFTFGYNQATRCVLHKSFASL